MVTSLLPEMEKKPAEFSVNAKLLALTVPPESVCVSVPIVAPEAAFVESVRLSMLIVMTFSALLVTTSIAVFEKIVNLIILIS